MYEAIRSGGRGQVGLTYPSSSSSSSSSTSSSSSSSTYSSSYDPDIYGGVGGGSSSSEESSPGSGVFDSFFSFVGNVLSIIWEILKIFMK